MQFTWADRTYKWKSNVQWRVSGVRKILHPARRPSTLALSRDGRLALGIGGVASVVIPSHVSAPAKESSNIPLSTALLDEEPDGDSWLELAFARANVQERSAGHFVVRPAAPSQFQSTSTSISSTPTVHDVQAVAWSPLHFGPSLVVVDGLGIAHVMRPPGKRQLGTVSDTTVHYGWHEMPLPTDRLGDCARSILCAQFTSITGGSNGGTDVALLALGAKNGLSLLMWSSLDELPVDLFTLHISWTPAVAWLERLDAPGVDGDVQAVRFLAAAMEGRVIVYRVYSEFVDRESRTPKVTATVFWASDDRTLPPVMVSTLAWWSDNADRVSLGVGIGNSLALFEWRKGMDATAPIPVHRCQTHNGHVHIVTAVTFLPSGQFLSASADGSVRIWNDDPVTTGIVLDNYILRPQVDRPVLGLVVSGLGLYVGVLMTVPCMMDDKDTGDTMNKKFASSSRLSRLFLHTPVLPSTCDLKSGLEDLMTSVASRLVLGSHEGRFAFVTWDLELWLDHQCLSVRNRAVEYLSMRMFELRNQVVESRQPTRKAIMLARALRSLSFVVHRYAPAGSRSAEQICDSMISEIIFDHCVQSLSQLIALQQTSNGSNCMKRLSKLEVCSARAMATFVLMCKCTFERDDKEACLHTAHATIRALACRTDIEGDTVLCPVCHFKPTPVPVVFEGNTSDMESSINVVAMMASCGNGDMYPRCVFTLLPCVAAVPISCDGCGSKAYPGLVADVQSGRGEFSWLQSWQRCPLCYCALQSIAVDAHVVK
jgi:WD40 repeat protein